MIPKWGNFTPVYLPQRFYSPSEAFPNCWKVRIDFVFLHFCRSHSHHCIQSHTLQQMASAKSWWCSCCLETLHVCPTSRLEPNLCVLGSKTVSTSLPMSLHNIVMWAQPGMESRPLWLSNNVITEDIQNKKINKNKKCSSICAVLDCDNSSSNKTSTHLSLRLTNPPLVPLSGPQRKAVYSTHCLSRGLGVGAAV